jgi:hypothetical protein
VQHSDFFLRVVGGAAVSSPGAPALILSGPLQRLPDAVTTSSVNGPDSNKKARIIGKGGKIICCSKGRLKAKPPRANAARTIFVYPTVIAGNLTREKGLRDQELVA